jgi:hypothetical protein
MKNGILKKMFVALGIAASVATFSFAKKPISIGSGGKGGNYYTVAQDIVDYCAPEIKNKYGYDLTNVSTDGSLENLNGILHKKYSIGFVQQDVYEYMKKRDQLNTIEMNTMKLMYLYPEYLHILIPRGWKPQQTGSWFSRLTSLFKPENKNISIQSLKGQTVYAKGGALVSAQALSYFMGLNLHVVNANDVKRINGPFIFVTGAGDSRIQKMLASGKWWLLSFNGNELANRVSFYKPASVTYLVGGKSVTANTVSIMSVAYARKYRSKKKSAAVKGVKECVKANIDDLIDDGNSDKWSIIAKTNGWISSDEDN